MNDESKLMPEHGKFKEPDFDVYFEYYVGSHRPGIGTREWRPAADVYETDKCVIVLIDIAGIRKEDVQLTLDKDTLLLEGFRREEIDSQRRHVHVMEVPYGPFRRVFPMPAPVCAENVKADYSRGFLKIQLKKRDRPLQRKMKVRIR